MSNIEFDFKEKIEALVIRLEAVTQNSKGEVLSCQLVNFNSENINKYYVYNYCFSLNEYEKRVAEYFADANNKSVVTIKKFEDEINDDLVWYDSFEEEEKRIVAENNQIVERKYHQLTADAKYDIDTTVEVSHERWKSWIEKVIKTVYPNAGGHFAKLKKIKLADKEKLYSGIFITFSKKINYIQIGVVSNICETLLNEIVHEDLFPKTYKKVQEQATRAAISQVMARNTSHNIGAHVMNKLIGDLSALSLFNFSDTANNNYQSTIEKNLKELHKEVETKVNKDFSSLTDAQKEKVLKHEILLEQISLFNNYVKCRMDYLADISFGTPLMQTNKYAYGELFKDLDKVRLLLEYISGLSDFKYEIRFTKNGEPLTTDNDLLVAIPNDILGTQAFYNILENIIRNTAKHSSTKPDITTFTVNFIDDVEKTGYCKCKKPCKCGKPTKTEVQNALTEFIAVEIFDNIPVEKIDEDLNLTEDEINEFKVKNTPIQEDNKFQSYVDKLVFKQNKKLNDDILLENKLRSSSLGLVEMDASAAYLRKRPFEFINHPSYDIQYDESWSRNSELNNEKEKELRGTNCRHFLKAFKKENVSAKFKDDPKTGNALGYRFFLHRPAVVLVITDRKCKKKDDLKKEGIWVVPLKPKQEEIKAGKKDESFETHLKQGKVYPHEFVVYTDDAVKAVIDEHKTSLPVRLLKVKESELEELFKAQNEIVSVTYNNETKQIEKSVSDKWEEFCWEMWYKGDKSYPKKNVEIMSIYEKVNADFFVEAVFLDHLYSNIKETPEQMWKNQICATHLEALSSLAQSKMPEFAKLTKDIREVEHKIKKYLKLLKYEHVVSNKNNVVTHHKIAESVLTKVIVIDERIQNTTKEPNKGGRDFMTIPYKCLFAKMGVIVPDISLNLSENSFDLVKKPLEEYIETEISNAKSTDFILIHYSILERMYKKEDIKSHIEKWAESINVVVTSGRGTPDSLSEKVRFVNLSSVITAFVDVRSKYAINYLLNSSRKSNKI